MPGFVLALQANPEWVHHELGQRGESPGPALPWGGLGEGRGRALMYYIKWGSPAYLAVRRGPASWAQSYNRQHTGDTIIGGGTSSDDSGHPR